MIRNCPWGYKCEKTWSSLEKTERDNVRHCSSCEQNVVFCFSREELVKVIVAKGCAAFDETLIMGEKIDPLSASLNNKEGYVVGKIGSTDYLDFPELQEDLEGDIDAQIALVGEWIRQVKNCVLSLKDNFIEEARSDIGALQQDWKGRTDIFGWENYQFVPMIEYASVVLRDGGNWKAEDCHRQMSRIRTELVSYKNYLKQFKKTLKESRNP